MLGAQARAAELAAASAAKQRQVSRELEDRQVPPNPAVSLSAFTKSQAANRNKGNKTWKPLVLDDIEEAEDPIASTPTGRITPKEASDKKIPTAPRAMVAGQILTTLVAQPQPRKAESPVINMAARQDYGPQDYGSQDFGSQDYGPQHHGGFPQPVYPQNIYLHQPMLLGGMPNFEQRYGSMMVPEDMSPTKQEQKFSLLENLPFPQMHDQDDSHFAQHGMMHHDDPFSHPLPFGQQYGWNNSGHDHYYQGFQMPYQQVGGYDNSSGGAYLPQASVQRPSQSNPVEEQHALPSRRATDQQACHESALRYQEPYDTERAMKDCVSKLKEKAKDGKTVLHNPDIRKEPQRMELGSTVAKPGVRVRSESRPPLVPWEVRRKESIRNDEWQVMPPPEPIQEPNSFTEIDGQNVLSKIKPAPGLPFPKIFGPPQLSLEGPDLAPPVGSAEWMRLAPITSAERDRVRRLMALAAKSVTNEVQHDKITSGQNKEDLVETQKWFYTDARGERLLRQQVDLSAANHASQVIANVKARNGGELPEGFQDGKDDGLAATLILGNVACNLQTYLVGDRKSVEQRRNFHKVKSVPDWCTERGGLAVGGLGSGDSYFDGATGGFYGAPIRVARDPRFRPQVKEGMKVKPEEEWKHRHEMYGRRMM
jgi:hypothetical protein